MIDLINRLQAYSADPKLRPDYAAAMIEAADELIRAAQIIDTLRTVCEVNREDARRFVFMAKSIFADEAELDQLQKAGDRVKDQTQPENIDQLRIAYDAIQAEYDKL